MKTVSIEKHRNMVEHEGIVQRRVVRIIEKVQENYYPVSHIELLDRIGELERKLIELQSKSRNLEIVDDTMAEEMIKAYLIEQQNKRKIILSIVDIVEALRLPVEQVETIMERLKTKGVQEVE